MCFCYFYSDKRKFLKNLLNDIKNKCNENKTKLFVYDLVFFGNKTILHLYQTESQINPKQDFSLLLVKRKTRIKSIIHKETGKTE